MPIDACARRGGGARSSAHVRACALAALLAAGLAPAAGAAAAPAHASRQACAAAAAVPGAAAAAELRRSLRCLVNSTRAAHGLRPLRADRRLGAAARRHAADMVARGYFAHERAGSTLRSRVRAADWAGAAAAEAIAWGCGRRGTPRAVLDAWLASPGHRAIVLGPYNRAGVGLALGAPLTIACSGAGTWVLDAGRR